MSNSNINLSSTEESSENLDESQEGFWNTWVKPYKVYWAIGISAVVIALFGLFGGFNWIKSKWTGSATPVVSDNTQNVPGPNPQPGQTDQPVRPHSSGQATHTHQDAQQPAKPPKV